jgi:hypothetical protein
MKVEYIYMYIYTQHFNKKETDGQLDGQTNRLTDIVLTVNLIESL